MLAAPLNWRPAFHVRVIDSLYLLFRWQREPLDVWIIRLLFQPHIFFLFLPATGCDFLVSGVLFLALFVFILLFIAILFPVLCFDDQVDFLDLIFRDKSDSVPFLHLRQKFFLGLFALKQLLVYLIDFFLLVEVLLLDGILDGSSLGRRVSDRRQFHACLRANFINIVL